MIHMSGSPVTGVAVPHKPESVKIGPHVLKREKSKGGDGRTGGRGRKRAAGQEEKY